MSRTLAPIRTVTANDGSTHRRTVIYVTAVPYHGEDKDYGPYRNWKAVYWAKDRIMTDRMVHHVEYVEILVSTGKGQ